MIHPDTQVACVDDGMGMGLVATALIPTGTLIWVQDPLDQIIAASSVANLSPLYAALKERFTYRIPTGDYILPWDDTRFMNHSCDYNCALTPFGFEVAICDIGPGQQLTNDYAMLHMEEDERLTCLCKSPACRTVITSADYAAHKPFWDRRIKLALQQVSSVRQPLLDLVSPVTLNQALSFYHYLPG